jgi:hypothetical protein
MPPLPLLIIQEKNMIRKKLTETQLPSRGGFLF